MVLSFTRVSPEELDRAFEEPELAAGFVGDEDRPDCYLDKAWAGIGFLLDEAGVWVDLYEDGDAIDEECTMFGWGRDVVAKAAELLSATPFSTLAAHYDPRKLSEKEVYPMRHLWDADDIGYLESYYGEVVTFFAATAASGNAAIRNFSF